MKNIAQLSGNLVHIGEFQFDKNHILGTGANGTVYLGYQYQETEQDQLIAVKEIPIMKKSQLSEALVNEINFLKTVQHENIVRLIHSYKTDTNFYLILEYCNDGSISDYLNKRVISEKQLLELYLQILKALQYLYLNEKFHRDINPNNILLCDQVVKLADFGTSKILTDKQLNYLQQQQYTCVGTFYYMSPEILSGEGWVPKSDIWSLGVTFYYMLTNELPWTQSGGSSFQQLLENIKSILQNDSLFDNVETHYSQQIQDLIKQMLKININERIDWLKLFEHELFRKELYEDKQNYMKNKLNMNFDTQLNSSGSITYQNKTMTMNNTLTDKDIILSVVKQDSNATHNQLSEQYIEQNGKKFHQTFQNQKIRHEKQRKVTELLQFELDKAEFFYNLTDTLKEAYIKSAQLPQKHPFFKSIRDNVYYKCQFLLSKKAAIITSDLSHICAFKNNKGNIWIDMELLETFQNKVKNKGNYRHHTKLLEDIQKFDRLCSKKFLSYNQKISETIFERANFDISSLEKPGVRDASHKIEDKAFVQSCVQTFSELFKSLGRILLKYIPNFNRIDASEIKQNIRIFGILAYQIVICLGFWKVFKHNSQKPQIINFQRFQQDLKYCGFSELLSRIEKAYLYQFQESYKKKFDENMQKIKEKQNEYEDEIVGNNQNQQYGINLNNIKHMYNDQQNSQNNNNSNNLNIIDNQNNNGFYNNSNISSNNPSIQSSIQNIHSQTQSTNSIQSSISNNSKQQNIQPININPNQIKITQSFSQQQNKLFQIAQSQQQQFNKSLNNNDINHNNNGAITQNLNYNKINDIDGIQNNNIQNKEQINNNQQFQLKPNNVNLLNMNFNNIQIDSKQQISQQYDSNKYSNINDINNFKIQSSYNIQQKILQQQQQQQQQQLNQMPKLSMLPSDNQEFYQNNQKNDYINN